MSNFSILNVKRLKWAKMGFSQCQAKVLLNKKNFLFYKLKMSPKKKKLFYKNKIFTHIYIYTIIIIN